MKSHGRTKNRRRTQRTRTSALARLTSVTEDPNGLNYATNYTYDALGNLLRKLCTSCSLLPYAKVEVNAK